MPEAAPLLVAERVSRHYRLPRDSVVVSTKCLARGRGAAEVVQALDGGLRRLKLDHVDVFLLHAVAPAAYGQVLDERG